MMTVVCASAGPTRLWVRRDFALRHHMALWDVIESCDIDGASDASIRNAVPNDSFPDNHAIENRPVFTTARKPRNCTVSSAFRCFGRMDWTACR